MTVYDGSPKYECAMPLWCTSAKQLSRHVLTTQRPSLTLTLTHLSMVQYEVILFVDMDADVLPQP